MARTSNVFARVEPEIKEQAEQVLDQLGIPDVKRHRDVLTASGFAAGASV